MTTSTQARDALSLLTATILVVAGVQRACAQPAEDRRPPAPPAEVAPARLGVDDFVRLAVERNPRLVRAAFAIDAARGRYVQAGLYPNPVFAFTADELGDRTGPSGILSPQISQEFVRRGKLKLSQAVAAREVDQATLNLLAERYETIAAVRAAFYEVLVLDYRFTTMTEVVRQAEGRVKLAESSRQLKGSPITEFDVNQLRFELERFRAEVEAVGRELPAAHRRLAAVAGDSRLPLTPLAGWLSGLPDYDLERTRETVLAVHPTVRSATVGVERARAALRRAQAEPIPNVTLTSGYTRQNQNRSNDWMVGVSVPVPVWNKNQGNIRSAQAELGAAIQDVCRVQNELAERVATAHRTYASAKRRVELYESAIRVQGERIRTQLDAVTGRQAGFDAFRAIQVQRTLADAQLEYTRALGEAWRAAAELSGLLLEEVWPPPAPQQQPTPQQPSPAPDPQR